MVDVGLTMGLEGPARSQTELLEAEIAELKRLERLTTFASIQKLLKNQWHQLEANLIVLEDEALVMHNTECILHDSTISSPPLQVTLEEQVLSSISNSKSGDSLSQESKDGRVSSFMKKNVELSSYAWDQCEQYTTLYVSEDLAGIEYHSADKTTCSFTPRSLQLQIRDFKNRDLHLLVESLFADIVPNKSKLKFRRDQILLKLCKSVPGQHWPSVTSDNSCPSDGAAIPPSSANAVNLLRTMYNETDGDTRRALAQAATVSRLPADAEDAGGWGDFDDSDLEECPEPLERADFVCSACDQDDTGCDDAHLKKL